MSRRYWSRRKGGFVALLIVVVAPDNVKTAAKCWSCRTALLFGLTGTCRYDRLAVR
jgi:hypothetical protein